MSMKKRLGGRYINMSGFIEWDWGRSFGGAALRIGPRRRDTWWNALYVSVGRVEDEMTFKPLNGIEVRLEVCGVWVQFGGEVGYSPWRPRENQPQNPDPAPEPAVIVDTYLHGKRVSHEVIP